IQKKIDGLVKEIEYARQRFLEDIEVTKDIQAVKLRLKNYRIQYKKVSKKEKEIIDFLATMFK
ncbi:MAG: hypothetical protein RMJ97_12395, partial [Raineya sp.]|nr:hypothetical protein [Raineya sp.]